MSIKDRVELTGVATLAGTAQEISRRLKDATNENVVAFILPNVTATERDAIAQTLATLVDLAQGKIIKRERARLESLVDAFLPGAAEPKAVLREAEMVAKARAGVLEDAEWLTAAQIADLADLSKRNSNAVLSRWKRDGRIFAIKPAGSVELFPAYGLNPANRYRPVPALAKVIEALCAVKDGWGLAYWFGSVNGFIGGRRPQDVIATEPQAVVEAARDEAEGSVHG